MLKLWSFVEKNQILIKNELLFDCLFLPQNSKSYEL